MNGHQQECKLSENNTMFLSKLEYIAVNIFCPCVVLVLPFC